LDLVLTTIEEPLAGLVRACALNLVQLEVRHYHFLLVDHQSRLVHAGRAVVTQDVGAVVDAADCRLVYFACPSA